jgi:hypothetical protein
VGKGRLAGFRHRILGASGALQISVLGTDRTIRERLPSFPAQKPSRPRTQIGCAGLGRWRIDLFAQAIFDAAVREGRMTSAARVQAVRPRIASIANFQTHAATIPSLLSNPSRTPIGARWIDAIRVEGTRSFPGSSGWVLFVGCSLLPIKRLISGHFAGLPSAHPKWVRGIGAMAY